MSEDKHPAESATMSMGTRDIQKEAFEYSKLWGRESLIRVFDCGHCVHVHGRSSFTERWVRNVYKEGSGNYCCITDHTLACREMTGTCLESWLVSHPKPEDSKK